MRISLLISLLIFMPLLATAQDKNLHTSNYWLVNSLESRVAMRVKGDIATDIVEKLSEIQPRRCLYIGSIPLVKPERRFKISKNFLRRRNWVYTSESLDCTMYMLFSRSQFGTTMVYRAPGDWLVNTQASISARRSRRSEFRLAITHMIGDHWEFGFKLEHESLRRRQYIFENGIRSFSNRRFATANLGNRAFVSFSYNFGR